MTENEKLDFILAEIQGIRTEIQGMKTEIQGMKTEIQDMKTEMQGIKTEVQGLKERAVGMERKINRLGVEQASMRIEIIHIDRKISDTYNLALDAWGQGIENRTWVMDGGLKI